MPLSVNPHTETYFDFSFPNSQTGYGVSVGFQVIKTTDGGITWNAVANEGKDVQSIYFVNAETGFVCGDNGKIFKSTDGGYNWNINLQANNGFYINDIVFTDLNTGYACSRDVVYKTSDQGASWDTLRNGIDGWQYRIDFVNNNTGYVTGDYGLYKTTNGGENWFYLDTIESAQGFTFVDEMTGYADSYYRGRIYKTTNGGYDWNTIFDNDTLDVYNIFAVGYDTVYAGTQKGIILKSVNGGSTWQYQYLDIQGTDRQTAGLYFINGTTGFCSGGINAPFFFYTTTGGTVGISTIGNEIPTAFKLYQNYPNPFNPETKIRFEIPQQVNNNYIILSIYNSLGQVVKNLVNEELQPGNYEYTFNASNLSSGIYFYRMQAGDFTQSKRMILLK